MGEAYFPRGTLAEGLRGNVHRFDQLITKDDDDRVPSVTFQRLATRVKGVTGNESNTDVKTKMDDR